MNKTFFIGALLLLFTRCGTSQHVSVIQGGEYDAAKDQTTCFALPYGSVAIPGKWEKGHYNAVSHQQFFHNSDSVELAIAFHAANGYPFNQRGKLKGHDFVRAFYEWDSRYFVETHGLSRSIVEEDTAQHYIIWELYGGNDMTYDSYFLFGEKNGNAHNFSISITDQWTAEEKVAFLKQLFTGK